MLSTIGGAIGLRSPTCWSTDAWSHRADRAIRFRVDARCAVRLGASASPLFALCRCLAVEDDIYDVIRKVSPGSAASRGGLAQRDGGAQIAPRRRSDRRGLL